MYINLNNNNNNNIDNNIIINNNNNNNNFIIPQYNIPKIQYILIIIISIFIYQILYGFTILYIFQTSQSYIIKIPISLLFYFFLIMSIICYIYTIIIDNKIDYEYYNKLPIDQCKNLSYCNACQCYRGLRSHHCRSCNVCINVMDHHCPWTANCIGEKNLKSFFLFIIYSFLTCFICFIFTLRKFIDYVNNNNNNNYILGFNQNFISKLIGNYVGNLPLFTFFLSSFFSLSLGIFIYFQYSNLKIGLTSIERLIYYNNLKECPDYNDNIIENIEKVFKNNYFLPFNKNEEFDENNKDEFKYIKLN